MPVRTRVVILPYWSFPISPFRDRTCSSTRWTRVHGGLDHCCGGRAGAVPHGDGHKDFDTHTLWKRMYMFNSVFLHHSKRSGYLWNNVTRRCRHRVVPPVYNNMPIMPIVTIKREATLPPFEIFRDASRHRFGARQSGLRRGLRRRRADRRRWTEVAARRLARRRRVD